jgi:hypothetical protein
VLYLNLQKPKFFCQVIPVGTPNTELSVCSCSSCRAIEFSMQLYLDVSAIKCGTCELDLHEGVLLV